MCAVVPTKWVSTGANEGFRPIFNSLNVKKYRKLLLVGIFWRRFTARGCKVLKVVSAEVHTEQFPQNELRWVVAAVVVRNQTMPQHQQGRQSEEHVAPAIHLHDLRGSDLRTKCHTRHAMTALTR